MKTAIITGGAKGIGRQIAIDLAKNNYNVVINYLSSEEEAKKTQELCKGSKLFKSDVSDEQGAKALVDYTIDTFGSIDLLVNNAGITRDSLVITMKEKDYDDVIRINQRSVFLMSKYSLKYMIKKRSGNIINISSVVGISGNSAQLNYSASKGAIISMTKSLAKEVARRNIRVNAIAPGFIKTDMTEKLSDEQKKLILDKILLNRFCDAKEISKTVLFLEDNNYITAQTIVVDGGLSI